MNNKMIKGSVAGATGIVLLMGGFGTYAVWSDSRDLQTNGVQSGDLTIGTTVGVYDDANQIGAGDWNGATDQMVPGDKVTYTQVFDITGNGRNLRGKISYVEPAFSSTFSGLLTDVQVVSSNGTVTETGDDTNNFVFEEPFGSGQLTATVTYELPASTTGTTDQLKSATLPAAEFLIEQLTSN